MDSSEFKNFVCRICLDENVRFDWNNTLIEHDDVTYKDCYYKYTQLHQLDDDPLSSMLCKKCSNSLEDVHVLVLKALDSYNFLLEVNLGKLELGNSNIVEDEPNCSSADFETVLVEKPEKESEMLEQYECESSDFLIKYEDELDNFDDEIQEVEEEHDDFDKNQFVETNDSDEDTWKVYETVRRKSKRQTSGKRRYEKDAEKEIGSKIRRTKGTQLMEIENKYDSIDETSANSEDIKLFNYIDSEGLQYEEILHSEDEQEEYETNQETEFKLTDDVLSKVYKTRRKKSKSVTSNIRSLKDADSNDESNFEKSQSLELEANENKTRNSSEKKRRKTKNENHLNSQNTPRMCSYCSKILHNKYALRKHEKTHLARERKAPCPICGVKFLEESYVKIHMQIHDQNRIKKHQCEFCDKAFYEKGSLNVHRRIHLGQMIPCTLCSKEFFRQVDLEIHMSSHSEAVINAETKKRSRYWVRCKYCNKDIMSTSFKYHMAVHLNEPQMKCAICDREFFRRDSCTEHLKTIHKKTTEEYSNFIIIYNKNRLSHLYLEQTAELKK